MTIQAITISPTGSARSRDVAWLVCTVWRVTGVHGLADHYASVHGLAGHQNERPDGALGACGLMSHLDMWPGGSLGASGLAGH